MPQSCQPRRRRPGDPRKVPFRPRREDLPGAPPGSRFAPPPRLPLRRRSAPQGTQNGPSRVGPSAKSAFLLLTLCALGDDRELTARGDRSGGRYCGELNHCRFRDRGPRSRYRLLPWLACQPHVRRTRRREDDARSDRWLPEDAAAQWNHRNRLCHHRAARHRRCGAPLAPGVGGHQLVEVADEKVG